MEVYFTAETEKKLKDLALESGRGNADELVQDVVEGYFDELAKMHEMIGSRYDELKSGRVKPIDGDEFFEILRRREDELLKNQVARMTAEQGFALHPLAAQDITEIWEYIAADNPLAARSVREEIYRAIRALIPFPGQGHRRPDLTSRPLRFIWYANTLLPMHRMKGRCGLWP